MIDIDRSISEILDDVKRMEDTELTTEKCFLFDLLSEKEDKKKNIDSQLFEARQNARENDIYSDKDWYQSASYASQMTGKVCQKIQRVIGFLSQ